MVATENILINVYENFRKKYGKQTYLHINEIFEEAKQLHKENWLKKPTKRGDHEQSWRAYKGKNFEKLIVYIIEDSVRDLGLEIINGNKLERKNNLPKELSMIKRNILVDFGEFGCHMPDCDMIIYKPNSLKIIGLISCKTTLRERIAQTGYWKLKLLQDELTKEIKVFFITPDSDGTLVKKFPTKKGRAIAEVELDGSYVLRNDIEESDNIKTFDKFIADLRNLI